MEGNKQVKYFNTFFNESYNEIKSNISLTNTNEDYKQYIYDFIHDIFRLIDTKYNKNKSFILSLNSDIQKTLLLGKFKKYMRVIIKVLLLLKKENITLLKIKIEKEKIAISKYVYENILNDTYILLKKVSKAGFGNKKYSNILTYESKNNAAINQNLKNIIFSKYSSNITNINE